MHQEHNTNVDDKIGPGTVQVIIVGKVCNIIIWKKKLKRQNSFKTLKIQNIAATVYNEIMSQPCNNVIFILNLSN